MEELEPEPEADASFSKDFLLNLLELGDEFKDLDGSSSLEDEFLASKALTASATDCRLTGFSSSSVPVSVSPSSAI